ncbi:MAG: PD-(D/E)XK nuclease family protein [Blautia sp.]
MVDYKSGNTKFDLAAFYYGLQLQLMVYLNAALELERRTKKRKPVIPAGIFYYHVEDPLLELSGDEDPEEIRKQLLEGTEGQRPGKQQEEIVRSMDRFLSGSSSVIPVSVNKDGSLGKASRTATTKQFAAMSAYAEKENAGARKRDHWKEGAERLPYERKNQTACDYCIFRSVCGFDQKDKNMKFRRLEELSADEALKKIEEEMK